MHGTENVKFEAKLKFLYISYQKVTHSTKHAQ